jgi:phosphate transport system substrate-binding protein
VAAIVSKHAGAIGYVGFGNIEDGLKVLAIDGVAPSKETVSTGEYGLFRPLYLMTGSLTHPTAHRFV